MSQMSSDPVVLVKEIVVLQAANEELQDENKSLRQQMDWLKRQIFGRKSEKIIIESPDQLGLGFFDDDRQSAPPRDNEKTTRRRGKKRRDNTVTDSGLRFDDTVPVEIIDVPAPELSGENRDDYEVIGEKVTRRLAQLPGSYVVLEFHQPVVKKKSDKTLTTAIAPGAVLERTFADVSFLAGLLVDKFCYHMPLYRQHQRLADAGITLSRASLTNYALRSIELLRPIYEAQWQHILKSRVLAVDETPVKAGRKQKKKRKQHGQMKTTYFWPIYGEAHEVCFSWSETRGSSHLVELLGDFKGILLSDGYVAYDSYAQNRPEVTQAGCWAHARRFFERAKDSDPAALHALDTIAAIYRVEKEIRNKELDRSEILEHRSRYGKPLVDEFLEWCRNERLRSDLADTDLLAKALSHAIKHKDKLQVYLSDPDVPIDTNHLERTLRVIPMGRKAWLFCWTEIGAELVGIIQSLLTTCRLQGVDPYTYLVDVLQRVADHPASRVEELTPRRWKELFADDPIRSDLSRVAA